MTDRLLTARQMEDPRIEARSRPCRAGLRPPVPLSPEEEVRDRSGFGLRKPARA